MKLVSSAANNGVFVVVVVMVVPVLVLNFIQGRSVRIRSFGTSNGTIWCSPPCRAMLGQSPQWLNFVSALQGDLIEEGVGCGGVRWCRALSLGAAVHTCALPARAQPRPQPQPQPQPQPRHRA